MTSATPSSAPDANLPDDVASADPAASADAGGPSLKHLAIRGSIWTVMGFGSSQILRLGGNLILTRALFPEAFGLMSVVNAFLQGLQMFSDIGIGPSIIQNERGDDATFLNTAWTIQIVRGTVLWLCGCLLAWPAARFFGQPSLAALIPVAATAALISGFEATALFTGFRKLHLGAITVLSLGSYATGLLVMIIWVWISPTVWALVGGGLVTALVKTVMSHVALPGIRNRLHWDRVAGRALFDFGRWIFVSTLLTFLAIQADRFIFAKMIPMSLLGVYSVGVMIATMPTQVVLTIGSSVVFPAYSRAYLRAGALNHVFSRARRPLVLGGAVAVACLMATGPALIEFLYDPRYVEAGWIIQLLACAAWFRILECTYGAAMLALGRAHWVAYGNAAKVVGMCVLMPLGYWWGGFVGAIIGLIVAEVAKYLTSTIGAHGSGLRRQMADVLLTTGIGISVGLVLLLQRYVLPEQMHALVRLVIGGAVIVVLWSPVAIWSLKRRGRVL